MPPDPPPSKVRIDRWLWAARFFKTRQLAASAIKAGHIALNGLRAKPARGVRTDPQKTKDQKSLTKKN